MSVTVRSEEGATLVAALAAGATYVDAAKQAGISERTARRRMDNPEFRRRVEDLRAEMLTQAVSRLTAATTAAVDALTALLGSEMDFARLGAARAILEIGIKYREQHDLAERVATLEERLGQQKVEKPWTPRTV